jgi:hypothetical protein
VFIHLGSIIKNSRSHNRSIELFLLTPKDGERTTTRTKSFQTQPEGHPGKLAAALLYAQYVTGDTSVANRRSSTPSLHRGLSICKAGGTDHYS